LRLEPTTLNAIDRVFSDWTSAICDEPRLIEVI